MDEASIRDWLLKYAWFGTEQERAREVECIMKQRDWEHIAAIADKYAGAQEESGPSAFSEGIEFALSSLYECHDEPHISTCPRKK